MVSRFARRFVDYPRKRALIGWKPRNFSFSSHNSDHPTMIWSYLLHAANGLYFLSYSVRDILWLRLYAILGMCLCMPYYFFKDDPDWPPLGWHAVFIGINLYQVCVLWWERKPIELTEVEQSLHRGPFRNLTPQQVRRVAQQGEWQQWETGAELVAEGAELHRLILLYEGEADVRTGSRSIASLQSGQFVGEMSLLTGAGASAQVISTAPARTLSWPEDWIETADFDNDLRLALQAAMGVDLVHKLNRMRPIDTQLTWRDVPEP